MTELENPIKIIIGGLDEAGKTSILTALDKKYDFDKDIRELKPTIKVEYHKTLFLGNNILFWDMGGQDKYRNVYQKRQDIYFAETDLLLYVIDIQAKNRFDEALQYLNSVLDYYSNNNMEVPVIIAFHKFDPEVRGDDQINNNIEELSKIILERHPSLKVLFQRTSIYDIISIVQLISYGLSIFDERFFDLSELLETYIEEFNCMSLILFDQNGIIISEFYSEIIDSDLYIELLESIKEHLYLLKRMREEEFESGDNFFKIEKLLSYLHKVKIRDQTFFISVLIKEELKESLLLKFSDFLEDLSSILDTII